MRPNLIEKVESIGNGFGTVDNDRIRVLLAAGKLEWDLLAAAAPSWPLTGPAPAGPLDPTADQESLLTALTAGSHLAALGSRGPHRHLADRRQVWFLYAPNAGWIAW